jgi:putative SOS response-associated peptidase YedK
MPAILAKEDREAWLSGSPDEAWSTLKPYADEHLVAWPVSRRVNTPKNNDPELVVPERTLKAS